MPLRNAGTSGKYNAAGLPGLTGNSDTVGWSDPTLFPSGVFSSGGTEWEGGSLQVVEASDMNGGAHVVIFDAADGNPIYGASDAVMPASADMTVALYLGRTA